MSFLSYTNNNSFDDFFEDQQQQSSSSSNEEVDIFTTFVEVNGQSTNELEIDLVNNPRRQGKESATVDSYHSSWYGRRHTTQETISVITYLKPKEVVIEYMQVFVKSLSGKTFTYNLKTNATVMDLQRDIYKRSGILEEQQKLMYEGRNLSDPEKALSEYGIRNEATVFMTTRLRGG